MRFKLIAYNVVSPQITLVWWCIKMELDNFSLAKFEFYVESLKQISRSLKMRIYLLELTYVHVTAGEGSSTCADTQSFVRKSNNSLTYLWFDWDKRVKASRRHLSSTTQPIFPKLTRHTASKMMLEFIINLFKFVSLVPKREKEFFVWWWFCNDCVISSMLTHRWLKTLLLLYLPFSPQSSRDLLMTPMSCVCLVFTHFTLCSTAYLYFSEINWQSIRRKCWPHTRRCESAHTKMVWEVKLKVMSNVFPLSLTQRSRVLLIQSEITIQLDRIAFEIEIIYIFIQEFNLHHVQL